MTDSTTTDTRYADFPEGQIHNENISPELTFHNGEGTFPSGPATPDPSQTDPRLTFVGRLPAPCPVENANTRQFSYLQPNPTQIAGPSRERYRITIWTDSANPNPVYLTTQATGGLQASVPLAPGCVPFTFTATCPWWAWTTVTAGGNTVYVVEETY